MEKKKWINPELKNMDSVHTHETECTCNVGGSPLTKDSKKHPCHKTGNGEHNDNGNHTGGVDENGHVPSVGCTDPTHYEDGVCICCCCGKTTGGQTS